MESFQVVELGEGIERAVLRGLSRWRCLRGTCPQEHPALLAISPKVGRRGLREPMACRTALLPGQGQEEWAGLRAASVVSYGTACRDSLTLSSCQGRRLWVALQREVVTVDGQVVERQEFPVERIRGMGPMPTLAVVGSLVLLGVPPEELTQGGNICLGH